MAAALFDSVRDICGSSKDEAANILQAFAGLSVAHAQRLAAKSGLSPDALKLRTDNPADDEEGEPGDVRKKIADYFKTLDGTGDDYDVQAAFANLLNSGEDTDRSS